MIGPVFHVAMVQVSESSNSSYNFIVTTVRHVQALLELEPPCGPVLPTLCGGRVALPLSRLASSLPPVDYKLTPHGFYYLEKLQEAGKMLRMRG